jgi:hypothetical protein
MPDLVIDLTRMRAIGSDLGVIAREFETANVHSDDVADATGHPALADAARSFAHSWDDTRGDMTETIRGLGETATAVADAFERVDGDLAAAFDDSGTGEAQR